MYNNNRLGARENSLCRYIVNYDKQLPSPEDRFLSSCLGYDK